MAPNKRRKKPASNPARGFATTSTASKSKIEEVSAEAAQIANQAQKQPSESKGQTRQGYAPSDQVPAEKQISELSPEELEKHLEQSELQSLIDRFGDTVQRRVDRHVSKLHTERRLLRLQADPLLTQSWLDSETIELIDRLTDEDHRFREAPVHKKPEFSSLVEVPEDDLVVALWTLHKLLPSLGFSDSQGWSVLQQVLQHNELVSDSAPKSSKDVIWSLDFCLDWLAREGGCNYRAIENVRKEKKLPKGPSASSREDASPKTSASNGSRTHAPAKSMLDPTVASSDRSQISDTTESEADSGSDLEPEEMIHKYVALQTRLFWIDPGNPNKPHKKGDQMVPVSPISRKSLAKKASIERKLSKIRSDILFDQVEAEQEWTSIRAQLLKETAERRRWHVKEEVSGERISERPVLEKDPVSDSPRSENIDLDDDMLGELFSSLNNAEVVPSKATPHLTSTNTTGDSIKTIDFGSWSGGSPRRVLEDTCKAK